VCLRRNRTSEEVEKIFDALDSERRAAILRGGVVHWNSTPCNVPREAQSKVHLNNFGSVAHDPGVVQPFPRQRWCRSCSNNRACVVVLGCGHLCFCYGCAALVKQGNTQCCPKCNGRVLDDNGKLQMQLIT
jgi:hypothetical protein